MQVCHRIQREVPFSIRRPIHLFRMLQRLMIVKPVKYCIIFTLVQFHVDWLKRLHFKDIISVIKRGFLIIKWWETHSFEMTTISFLSSHHDPHRSPLSSVDGLDNFGDLINEGDGSSDMIEDSDCSYLFPGHWYIFQ